MTEKLIQQKIDFKQYIDSACNAVYDYLQLYRDGKHARLDGCDVRCVVEEEKISALCVILKEGYQKELFNLPEINLAFPQLFYSKHRNDKKSIDLIVRLAGQGGLVKKQKPKLKRNLEILFESIG